MIKSDFRVLVAEKEPEVRRIIVDALRGLYRADFVQEKEEASDRLTSGNYSLAFIGEGFRELAGRRTLLAVREKSPQTRVVMVFTRPDLASQAEAMDDGAEAVIMYPFSPRMVRAMAQKARESALRTSEISRLMDRISERYRATIGYNDPGMATARIWAEMAAQNNEPLLIVGERGLGKELLARAIHLASRRALKSFEVVVAHNASRDEIGEALFGSSRKSGAIEQADGRTLLIRGVGELPLPVQENLLEIMNKGEGYMNVRFMFTTRIDLHGAALRGEFNPDLHSVLESFSVNLPPLRERPEAISVLAERLLERYSERLESPAQKLHRSARELLTEYSWPGNLWELEKVIALGAARASGHLLVAEDLPELTAPRASASIDQLSLQEILTHKLKPLVDTVDELSDANLHESIVSKVEKSLIHLVMEKVGGNQIKAAQALGIHRNTLRKKLYQLGIKTKG